MGRERPEGRVYRLVIDLLEWLLGMAAGLLDEAASRRLEGACFVAAEAVAEAHLRPGRGAWEIARRDASACARLIEEMPLPGAERARARALIGELLCLLDRLSGGAKCEPRPPPCGWRSPVNQQLGRPRGG